MFFQLGKNIDSIRFRTLFQQCSEYYNSNSNHDIVNLKNIIIGNYILPYWYNNLDYIIISEFTELRSECVKLKPQEIVKELVVGSRLQTTQKVFFCLFNSVYEDFCALDLS